MSDRPAPSTTVIGAAIIGAFAGFFIGQASSLGLFASRPSSTTSERHPKKSWPNSYDVMLYLDSSDEELNTRGESGARDEEETSDEEDAGENGELSAFEGNDEGRKMVLVVRTDLGMGKGIQSSHLPHCQNPPTYTVKTTGKIAAQASHAALHNYKSLISHPHLLPLLRCWESTGSAKIALQAKSEEELETLQAQAISLGLCAGIIHDAGRTQIAAGSATVLGIGPGPKSVVDQVTGALKLL